MSDKVTMNMITQGTRNPRPKTLGPINEIHTQCLQRYVVFGYESNRNDLFLNINNNVLQIIPRE
jgi:hypothetical protein